MPCCSMYVANWLIQRPSTVSVPTFLAPNSPIRIGAMFCSLM